MAEVKKLIQSTTGPLERLILRKENLDFRLDQPQWESLNEGDIIEYWEDFTGWDKKPSKKSRRIKVKIVRIIKAKTFEELIKKTHEINFSAQEKKVIFENLRKYWTPEKENKVGVLGFHVKMI